MTTTAIDPNEIPSGVSDRDTRALSAAMAKSLFVTGTDPEHLDVRIEAVRLRDALAAAGWQITPTPAPGDLGVYATFLAERGLSPDDQHVECVRALRGRWPVLDLRNGKNIVHSLRTDDGEDATRQET